MANDAGHTSYKYDLAFSLCDEDLPFAERIYRGLSERFSLFLYSEDKKTLEFQNGVIRLSNVYRKEARAVIVIWRAKWGQSRWTRLEQEVLTDRLLSTTAAFILLVKMESGETPSWIPSSYIYRMQEGWELGTLVETIAGKVNQLGGEIHELTPVELAAKHQAERNWKTKREQLLLGQDAQDALVRETQKCYALLKTQVQEINGMSASSEEVRDRPMEFEEQPHTVNVIKYPCCTLFNDYDDAGGVPFIRRMNIQQFDGVVGLYGTRGSSVELAVKQRDKYGLDVDQFGNWFWRHLKSNRAVTSERLVAEALSYLLKRSNDFLLGKANRSAPPRRDPLDDDDNFYPIGEYNRY